jgi:hypothetical protein
VRGLKEFLGFRLCNGGFDTGWEAGFFFFSSLLTVGDSVLMLATFQMILFAVRAKRNHDLRVAAMTEKTWRADDTFARPVSV